MLITNMLEFNIIFHDYLFYKQFEMNFCQGFPWLKCLCADMTVFTIYPQTLSGR